MKRALPVLLLVAACGSAASRPSVLSCSEDSQCPSGQVCLDIGCAVPDQNLVVQVVPPSTQSDTLATEDFANIDDSKSIDLQLGPPGTLALSSTLYPFALTLTGTPLHLPDLPIAINQPPPITSATQIAVAPGNYQLLATPLDSIIPPIEAIAVIGAPGASLDLPLQFLTADALVEVDGVLHGGHLLVDQRTLSYSLQVLHEDGTPASQPGLATLPDGGEPVDDSLPFTLYVAPTSAGEILKLVGSPQGGVGPTISFSGTLDALRGSAGDGGLGVGSTQIFAVQGKIVDPAGASVAGASVQLLAELPGQARFSSSTVMTDDGGAFSAQCLHDPDASTLNEAYQVLVIPPRNSNLAVVSAPATVTWASSGATSDFGTVSLTTLTNVSGKVLDNTGSAVANAGVQATPTSDNSLPLTPASGSTDATGAFTLALSPGNYHFDFTPPITLQAPSASRGPLAVSGATTRIPDVQLSAPRVVSGSVSDPNNQPVPGALVSVYFVPPPPGGNGTPPAQHSTLLARGTVLHDGTFSVVLPAPSKTSN